MIQSHLGSHKLYILHRTAAYWKSHYGAILRGGKLKMQPEAWLFSHSTRVVCHRVHKSNSTSDFTFFCYVYFISFKQFLFSDAQFPPRYYVSLLWAWIPTTEALSDGIPFWKAEEAASAVKLSVWELLSSTFPSFFHQNKVGRWDCCGTQYMKIKSLLTKSAFSILQMAFVCWIDALNIEMGLWMWVRKRKLSCSIVSGQQGGSLEAALVPCPVAQKAVNLFESGKHAQ